DVATLPAGSTVVGDESHILWFTRGLALKANFGVRCSEREVSPDEVAAKPAAATTAARKLPGAVGLFRFGVRVAGKDGALPAPAVTAARAVLDAPGPQSFRASVAGAPPLSWTLTLWRYAAATDTRTPLRELSGRGAPPAEIAWDGQELTGDAAYLYQLNVV